MPELYSGLWPSLKACAACRLSNERWAHRSKVYGEYAVVVHGYAHLSLKGVGLGTTTIAQSSTMSQRCGPGTGGILRLG
jgi:hypothetical protein